MSKVAIIKGQRSLDTVYKAIDLIHLEDALTNWNKILIKPNLITSNTWDTGETTDPLVVEAIITKVRELNKEVFVVETDAQIGNADKAIVATGMKEMLDRLGVEFLNMRHLDDKVKLQVKDGKALSDFKVAKIAAESAIISAAKLKTLSITDVTLGFKNMFGMLTTKWKFKYHTKNMHKVIHDICVTLPPAAIVIDGFVGMEGGRPFGGTPVTMDLVIASTDPVAADATGARVMGLNPEEIDHIKWIHQRGFGEITDIEILGEKLEDVFRVFK